MSTTLECLPMKNAKPSIKLYQIKLLLIIHIWLIKKLKKITQTIFRNSFNLHKWWFLSFLLLQNCPKNIRFLVSFDILICEHGFLPFWVVIIWLGLHLKIRNNLIIICTTRKFYINLWVEHKLKFSCKCQYKLKGSIFLWNEYIR